LTGGDPPQGCGRWVQGSEPLTAAAHEAAVVAAVGEVVQLLVALPDGEIDGDQIVAEELSATEMTESARIRPDEAGSRLREPVDLGQDGDEIPQLG